LVPKVESTFSSDALDAWRKRPNCLVLFPASGFATLKEESCPPPVEPAQLYEGRPALLRNSETMASGASIAPCSR
jgi:hypothetical protein